MTEWTHIAARKALGQHFLHDERVLQQIANLARPEPGSGLLEIGPGTGNLTEYLLMHGCPFVAVERDRRLPPLLRERFGEDLDVVRADATRVDYSRLLAPQRLGPAPVVVGNLPYNVGTEILFSILQSPVKPARLVLMLQREVVLRLVADPGTSAYGLLTVKIGIRANVRNALRVRPGAFSPPPRVESAVVVIEPLAQPRFPIPSYPRLCRLLDAGFGLRRKTLSNALRNRLAIDPERTREALAKLSLDARSRAESLSIEQWATLATELDAHIPATATGKRTRKNRKPSPPSRGTDDR